MTGLEKIKSQILSEARALADNKVEEAKADAQKITSQAEAEAEKSSELAQRKSEADVKAYEERVASAIDLKRRTRILEAKQEVIADVLKKAYDSLIAMDEKEYFALLLKMLDKYALPEAGEIFFAASDLARMSNDFRAEVEKSAASKGGSLVISEEGRKIENGFVLAYGGIEENCTLQAIFDAKKDELSDKVHRIIFA